MRPHQQPSTFHANLAIAALATYLHSPEFTLQAATQTSPGIPHPSVCVILSTAITLGLEQFPGDGIAAGTASPGYGEGEGALKRRIHTIHLLVRLTNHLPGAGTFLFWVDSLLYHILCHAPHPLLASAIFRALSVRALSHWLSGQPHRELTATNAKRAPSHTI